VSTEVIGNNTKELVAAEAEEELIEALSGGSPVGRKEQAKVKEEMC
jgi:hypothetical protein